MRCSGSTFARTDFALRSYDLHEKQKIVKEQENNLDGDTECVMHYERAVERSSDDEN